jgi:CheY-like chemotaxis protein
LQVTDLETYKKHQGPAVLVVDDDPGMVELIQMALRHSLSASVDSASLVSEAVHLLRQRKYDVLLLDHWLADGDDGFTLAQLVREGRVDEEVTEIPIILISASSGSPFDSTLVPLPFGMLPLPKPFKRSELADAVKDACGIDAERP